MSLNMGKQLKLKSILIWYKITCLKELFLFTSIEKTGFVRQLSLKGAHRWLEHLVKGDNKDFSLALH